MGKEPRKLSLEEIRLITSMSEQIGIAVENIKLFENVRSMTTELENSNKELREALEQQTATSEILRVIASSLTNLQPLLDTMASRGKLLNRCWRKIQESKSAECYRYGEPVLNT